MALTITRGTDKRTVPADDFNIVSGDEENNQLSFTLTVIRC
jgi:hypothetical protein